MGTITHAHQTVIANDPSKDVSANAWNAGHAFSLAKADVGLGNVDNTSDAGKPISTATQAALNAFRPPLTNGTTINVPSQYATLQLALAYAATIDFAGFRLTIQLANGTYTGPFIVPVTVGQRVVSSFIIQGDTSTPGNVVLNATNPFGGIVEVTAGTRVLIQGVQFVGQTGFEHGIHAANGGVIEFQFCDFGANMYFQRFSESSGSIASDDDYSISGSAQSHIGAGGGGFSYDSPASTITLSGTPNFALCFLIASDGSFARVDSSVFAGSGATGQRYIAQKFGVINVNGAGANYLPGNAPGDATGGIYG